MNRQEAAAMIVALERIATALETIAGRTPEPVERRINWMGAEFDRAAAEIDREELS